MRGCDPVAQSRYVSGMAALPSLHPLLCGRARLAVLDGGHRAHYVSAPDVQSVFCTQDTRMDRPRLCPVSQSTKTNSIFFFSIFFSIQEKVY